MNKGDQFKQLFLVDSKTFNTFLNLFKDHNLLHTDDKYAQKKGFKKRVVHGNILCGFLSFFIGECLPIDNILLIKQEINFNKPVYLNDSLSLIATIEEFHNSVQITQLSFEFRNQHQQKVASGYLQIKTI